MSGKWTRQAVLFVVSGPSGVGKTTLCQRLQEQEHFVYSVSCTTRKPRPGEIDGRDYYFLERKKFEAKIADNAFLEYAVVHGNFYGTLKETVLNALNDGSDVLLEIDTQGAAQVRNCQDQRILHALCDVFIMPPGIETLRDRLKARGSEASDQIDKRLQIAQDEMARRLDYQYTIVTGTEDEDWKKFHAIFISAHCLVRRQVIESTSDAETSNCAAV